MKIQLFILFLIGNVVLSVMVGSCGKDENVSPDTPDYSKDKGEFIDSRDGNTYKWVKIGKQIWMAENLAFKVDSGGCWAYENDKNYVNAYGYLYNWRTAKAVAPEGWHLPTDAEWTQLEDYLKTHGYSYDGVEGSDGIAKSLAADNGWNISDITGAVGNSDFPDFQNKTGFSALPGGSRLDNKDAFFSMGIAGYWWSSTENSSGGAYGRFLKYDKADVIRYSSDKPNAFSVRCIKD